MSHIQLFVYYQPFSIWNKHELRILDTIFSGTDLRKDKKKTKIWQNMYREFEKLLLKEELDFENMSLHLKIKAQGNQSSNMLSQKTRTAYNPLINRPRLF